MTDHRQPPTDDLPARAPLGDRSLSPQMRGGLWGFAAFCTIVLIAVFIGFLMFVDRLSRLDSEFGGKVDAVVALTGGPDRITEALSVLAEGRAGRLLITGVGDKTPVSDLVRQSGHAGLFECCVDIDRAAMNTVGNAIETAKWVQKNGYRTLMVVTSNYHTPRSLVELRRHLKNVEFVPHPVIAESVRIDEWWRDFARARLIFTEYLKFLVAEARSRLVPDNPKTPDLKPN